jgi:hypothetical protein
MRHTIQSAERGVHLMQRHIGAWLDHNSNAAVNFFNLKMEKVIGCWLAGMTLLALAKVVVAANNHTGISGLSAMILPFLAVTMAPVLGYRVAASCFPRGIMLAQPAIRLCRYGKWRELDHLEARRNRDFGPTGFMASLLIGMLLNVPFRTTEFMLAMPAMPATAPDWAITMMTMMTLDVVILSFFYTVCFVMALRSTPLFPRMLIFTWLIDVAMQFQIAQQVTRTADLPYAVAHALEQLLSGNIEKVLISAALWLPYLILSQRVNLTFRHRIRY